MRSIALPWLQDFTEIIIAAYEKVKRSTEYSSSAIFHVFYICIVMQDIYTNANIHM